MPTNCWQSSPSSVSYFHDIILDCVSRAKVSLMSPFFHRRLFWGGGLGCVWQEISAALAGEGNSPFSQNLVEWTDFEDSLGVAFHPYSQQKYLSWRVSSPPEGQPSLQSKISARKECW